MNSLYNFFQPQSQSQSQSQMQMNNPMGNFLTRFNQFRSMFNGNAEQQVKQLLSSGKMNQEQFNQLAQTANQLRQLIK